MHEHIYNEFSSKQPFVMFLEAGRKGETGNDWFLASFICFYTDRQYVSEQRICHDPPVQPAFQLAVIY